MVCVPFGAREDRVLNKIMANNHKGRCVRATKGKVYYENMTGRYQRSIDCNYSNGVKISISAKLYWKNGCSRYVN